MCQVWVYKSEINTQLEAVLNLGTMLVDDSDIQRG
jgi:hypothetical protein